MFINEKKMGSGTAAIHLQTAQPASLTFHVGVSDGENRQVMTTDSSVQWRKPENATWQEAGRVEVLSLFNPLVQQMNRTHSHSNRNSSRSSTGAAVVHNTAG